MSYNHENILHKAYVILLERMRCIHQIICPTLQSILMDYYTFVYLVESCPMYNLMNILHWADSNEKLNLNFCNRRVSLKLNRQRKKSSVGLSSLPSHELLSIIANQQIIDISHSTKIWI